MSAMAGVARRLAVSRIMRRSIYAAATAAGAIGEARACASAVGAARLRDLGLCATHAGLSGLNRQNPAFESRASLNPAAERRRLTAATDPRRMLDRSNQKLAKVQGLTPNLRRPASIRRGTGRSITARRNASWVLQLHGQAQRQFACGCRRARHIPCSYGPCIWQMV